MSAITAMCRTVVVAFLILCSTLSCQTHSNRTIHETDELSVMLRAMSSSYPALAPYQHPYTIQGKDVSDILVSLRYESGTFLPLSRRGLHQVFTKKQVAVLGPALSKALGQASPEDVLAFSLSDTEKPDRRTNGLAFVLGDELHLIIQDLRKPVYQGEQNTYQQQVPKWELLPGDNQRHYASRPGGKGTITNWIIIPLR